MRIFPNASFMYFTILFTLYSLASVFLLVSRRANARAEAPAPASRLLPQMAQALLSRKNPSKARRRLARLLVGTHQTAYGKLKLLPSAQSGRRLNLFVMLAAAWLSANCFTWLVTSETVKHFLSSRHNAISNPPVTSGIQTGFFLEQLFVILMTLLPLFLLRKNREFYFDVTALFVVLAFTCNKVLFCWRAGCCMGIPWARGVYNVTLDTKVFPVQFLEFGIGICIFAGGLLFMLFGKAYRPGRGCSYCLFSFMGARFFIEYLRYRGEDYRVWEMHGILGLTMAQTACLAAMLAAVAWLFLLPLEKKLVDRLQRLAAGGLRRLAVKAYFHPRLHPALSKHLGWHPGVAALEKAK